VRDVLTAIIWEDKWDECILTMCTNHQWKATCVMNAGELINLPPLNTTLSTWATLTKGTEWLIAIQLVGENGSGQINYSLACWIEHYWIFTSF
jgi:hypothetical protein